MAGMIKAEKRTYIHVGTWLIDLLIDLWIYWIIYLLNCLFIYIGSVTM